MSDNNIKENLKYHIDKKGWSLSKIAKKTDMSIDTLKGILYRDNKGSRVSTLVKLANILECSVENLVGSHKEHVQIKPKYADIYDDCSVYIEAYMERKKILLDVNQLNRLAQLLYKLMEKKQNKNIEYDIDDDIIEWLIENF